MKIKTAPHRVSTNIAEEVTMKSVKSTISCLKVQSPQYR